MTLCIVCFSALVLAQRDITDLSSGQISAQYNDSPTAEDILKAIDNLTSTKYLTHNPSGWIQFQTPAPYVVSQYTITSANDYPERDPTNWTFEGSANGTT
jgi:hypothetical protein